MTPEQTEQRAKEAQKRVAEFAARSAGQHMRAMREQYERERDALPDSRDLDYWLKKEK